MTLKEAIATFEAQFDAVDATTTGALDIHVFTAAGLRPEGAETGCMCLDEATAVRLWLLNAMEYRRLHPKTTTLIWRIKPEVEDTLEVYLTDAVSFDTHTKLLPLMPRKVWRIYSRFALR